MASSRGNAQNNSIRVQNNSIRTQSNSIRAQNNSIRAQNNSIRAQNNSIRAQNKGPWLQSVFIERKMLHIVSMALTMLYSPANGYHVNVMLTGIE